MTIAGLINSQLSKINAKVFLKYADSMVEGRAK